LVGVVVVVSAGCGSRTQLRDGERTVDASPAAPFCTVVEDCPGFDDLCRLARCEDGRCIYGAPAQCNDGDPCTDDSCDSKSGECAFIAKTFDLDNDGFKGPLPGKSPTDPAACGDDCDDSSAAAFPGGGEICDGVDNDCNGVVDDGAQYVPRVSGPDAVRISRDGLDNASPGALATNGENFFVTYGGNEGGKGRLFGTFIDAEGKAVGTERRLTQIEPDAFDSRVAWTGDRFGVAWSDRRFDNYEVFFALFDRNGQKLNPGDVRISDTPQYSINETVAFTGAEFVMVWQEGQGRNGSFSLSGQRIALDGSRVDAPVTISTEGESPSAAVGRPGLGIAWGANNRIFFAPFDFALKPLRTPVELTRVGERGSYPDVVWNRDAFVVTWTNTTTDGKTSVSAAVLDGMGTVRQAGKTVSDSPRFARDGSVLPLGDRMLMVYSDTRDQNGGYELYTRMLTSTLDPLGNSARVTNGQGDSVFPRIAFGAGGQVGVIFRDDRLSKPNVYYTNLVCRAVTATP